jgi:hypothetical protein
MPGSVGVLHPPPVTHIDVIKNCFVEMKAKVPATRQAM